MTPNNCSGQVTSERIFDKSFFNFFFNNSAFSLLLESSAGNINKMRRRWTSLPWYVCNETPMKTWPWNSRTRLRDSNKNFRFKAIMKATGRVTANRHLCIIRAHRNAIRLTREARVELAKCSSCSPGKLFLFVQ